MARGLAGQRAAVYLVLDRSGSMRSYYRDGNVGRVAALHDTLGHMGTTNYAAAMDEVIDHYVDAGTDDPAFVIFQTDGGPDSRRAAEQTLCKAARLPMFWRFRGSGWSTTPGSSLPGRIRSVCPTRSSTTG